MADGDQGADVLSKREKEVATAYASGESYKEIARSLGLSPTTVRTHLRTVYSKLGVTSKIELARFLDDTSSPEQTLDRAEIAADLALELDDAVRRERSLAKVLKIVSDHGGDLETVIDAVLDHALEICEAEFGILFEYHGDMKFRELRSRNIEQEFADWLIEQQVFKVDPGTGIGRVASEHQTVNVADVRGEDIYRSGAPLRLATADLGKARSFAAIPMMSGGRLIGAFTVYRTRVHPFNDRALELASAFADQAVIAIENVRQFRELQTRLERGAATREILEIISRSRDDEQPVFDMIVERARTLCGADIAGLILGEEGGPPQHAAAQSGVSDAMMNAYRDGHYPMDPDLSAAAKAIIERRVVHLEDAAEEAIYQRGAPERQSAVLREGIRSNLHVPLISGGRGIGCLVLARLELRPYSPDEIALVETFAAQAVIAIENVRQFRELQTRLEREAASREILAVISQSRDDATPVFEALLDAALRLCGSSNGALVLGEDGGGSQVLAAQTGATVSEETLAKYRDGDFPMDPDQSLAARAIIECETLHYPDIEQGEPFRQGMPVIRKLFEKEGIRSSIYVPLISNGKGVGCLNLHHQQQHTYAPDEIALLETFAAQAVIAIENVHQFRELQARLEREAASRDILGAISRSRDEDGPVFDVILENAARLCDAPYVGVTIVNEERTAARIIAQHGARPEFLEDFDLEFPLDRPFLVSRAINEAVAVQIEDMTDDDLYRQGDPIRQKIVDVEGVRTMIAVPLLGDGEPLGSIVLYRREVKAFTPEQMKLLETFAAQAVIAIENVRQFRALQTRLEREAATRGILEVISRSRDDYGPVFDRILEDALRLCEAEFGGVVDYLPEDTHVRMVKHRGLSERAAAMYREDPPPIDPDVSVIARSMLESRTIHVDVGDLTNYRGESRYGVLAAEEGIRTGLFVPLMIDDRCVGLISLIRYENRDFNAEQIALLETFAAQAAIAIENVRQFKELETLNAELGDRVEEQVGEIERMGKLKSFLPSAVADAVVSSGSDDMLKSHRALLGILFCDIRGFTAFCETAEPEETIEVLQTYHQEMGKLIAEFGAGVDHRMGDGIMVLFNDPIPCDDPAGDAVRLAMAMRKKMAELSKGWKKLGHRLGFGVGVSMGYATVGMVGYEERSEYTASGTAVNLAARLCDSAEDGEILLSPRAAIAVEDEFRLEPGEALDLKGLSTPVEVMKVVGPVDGGA